MIFVCLFFYARHFFLLAKPRFSICTRQILFSLDVQFIHSFSQLIQFTKLLHLCITKLVHISYNDAAYYHINYYKLPHISDHSLYIVSVLWWQWLAKSIIKAIYLKLSVKIPQPYVSFCFLLKFVENYKILDPRKTHEKTFWTHEIPTRNFLGPRNTHEKLFFFQGIPSQNYGPTKVQWHGSTRPTRPTMARDPRNFAHLT